MSNKVRLISTISAICMVLALLTVGVWAVSTASVTLGGSVSFTADNIHARVTGSVTGTQETISLAELDYSADSAPTTELDSWTNNSMTFTSENLITMTITVENLSEERSLFVTLTDNTTTDNVGKTLKQGESNYTSGSAVEVTAGNTTTFTMTLSVTDKNQSASATVSYQVDLRDANAPEPIALLHDTENDYYYVEMGEYNEAPVRWRVVGVNGQHYTHNENQAPSGELTFILETLTTSHIFGHMEELYDDGGDLIGEEGNNQYYSSAIRQYITGKDCALTYDGLDFMVSGNYLEDININTESNKIYKQIKEKDSDKLWIPSAEDMYVIVGGGDSSLVPEDGWGSTMFPSWDDEVETKLDFHNSPYAFSTASAVDSHYVMSFAWGEVSTARVDDPHAVRPMFILEV